MQLGAMKKVNPRMVVLKQPRVIPKKLRGYIELIRPFTLLAPFVGGVSGALIACSFNQFANFSLLTLIYGAVTLVMVNAASNALNQVADVEIDKINKPYRPIPAGIVSTDEAMTIALILYLVALLRAALVNLYFGMFVCAIMIITVFYSIPPVKLKRRVWIANISIASTRGLFGFVAAWCIFGSPFNPTPWLIGTIIAIYLLGAITTKDFTDIEGDKMYNVKTLPVVYGTQKSIVMSAPFFVVPFVLIPLGAWSNFLKPTAMYLSILVIWGTYIVFLLCHVAERPDRYFENSPVWKHMYLMLMALQVGFCIVYIF
jgi:4-hydroxybenzoate polyprenyltransferase